MRLIAHIQQPYDLGQPETANDRRELAAHSAKDTAMASLINRVFAGKIYALRCEQNELYVNSNGSLCEQDDPNVSYGKMEYLIYMEELS